MDWLEIINKLPEQLQKLFYDTWNGDMLKCNKCGLKYPKHRLFYRTKRQQKDGFLHTCKECLLPGKGVLSYATTVLKEYVNDGQTICSKCGVILPNTDEYFTNNSSKCKKCAGISKYGITIHGENVKLSKQGLKKCKYCGKIKPISEYKKVGKTRIQEYCNDCIVIAKNDKSAYDNKNYNRIKDTRKKYYKKWKLQGGQEIRKVDNRKRKLLKINGINDFTINDWKDVKKYFNNSCAYCGKGDINLQQEHVVAITKGGNNTRKNVVPACPDCNVRKNNKKMEVWYKKQVFFNAQNLKKIYKWMSGVEI